MCLQTISTRPDIFTLDGITGSQREYIHWLHSTCGEHGKPEGILTTEAIELLAEKLRTPLQIQLHLTLAMEAGYQTGEKPITASLIESVLSRQLNDQEPTLRRHGYRLKEMVELFDARPAEIRAFFNNRPGQVVRVPRSVAGHGAANLMVYWQVSCLRQCQRQLTCFQI